MKCLTTEKLWLTGLNLVRAFNSRSGCVYIAHYICYLIKRPNLKLKNQPRELLNLLPFGYRTPRTGYAAVTIYFKFDNFESVTNKKKFQIRAKPSWCWSIEDHLRRILEFWDRIHNTSFSSYLKYRPIKLECFITPH